MTDIENHIDEFWAWFRIHEQALSAFPRTPELMHELDQKINALNPEVSWEIGPGKSNRSRFVISPNLNRDLASFTRLVVQRAPHLAGWEFYPFRPPKAWDYRFEFEGENDKLVSLDASNWHFVLLQYPDDRREILLRGYQLPRLTETERWQACAIVLESILGEAVLLDKVNEFELVHEFEPEFASREQLISRLYRAVTGAPKPN